MSKRILILSANPKQHSFTHHLAECYAQSAKTKHDVVLLTLSDMVFNPDLSEGYAKILPMETSLQTFQKALLWCEHFVIFTPVWWGALPAKCKGLLDRTLLPGFAFKYEKNQLAPTKLLQGKTARIILTMDTPPWYYKLFQGAPAIKQLKIATLTFVGFTRIKTTMIGPIINSTKHDQSQWVKKIETLGYSAN